MTVQKFVKLREYYFMATGAQSIIWPNAVVFVVGHFLWVVSLQYLLNHLSLETLAWNFMMTIWSGLGVTAGAHRLWAHRSYKARLPLKFFLALGHSIAGQNCLYVWCRDHRVHHCFSDTDADPHNIHRGVFFSHVGWLVVRKHPRLLDQASRLSFADLDEDPVVCFQKRHYYAIYALFALLIPTLVPVVVWHEDVVASFFVNFVYRQGFVLHSTWFVNSAAHLFGHRPFNSRICPAENGWVSLFSIGEGYHNYHHTFPYDYVTAEFGGIFNFTKTFIDVMQFLGFAYDLKKAKNASIEAVRQKNQIFCSDGNP